jgi:hypothetical protein
MQAAEARVQKVLEGTQQFLVPHYQRPYSWQRAQWETLWRGVLELLQDPASRPHFLGSLVTAPALSLPEGVDKRLLIDGQQRLTTLFVLLAQIRDKASSTGANNLADKITDLITNRREFGNDVYKLLPTQGDSAEQSDRDAFIAAIDGKSSDTSSGISEAREFFSAKLKRADAPSMDDLFRTISTKLTIVSIVLDNNDNPHRIFESLNGKGRPLSQVDLIRNYFFMRLPSEDHERVYRELWQPMQKRLGEEHLTEFVRHYLMHFGSPVNEADVYATLKERVEKNPQPVIEHLRELVALSKHYALFSTPHTALPAISERLTRLGRLEVTVSYPFLLPTYADFANGELSEAQLCQILDIVESFVVRRFICGVSTQGLGKIFTPLYQKAKKQPVFIDAVKAGLNAPRDHDFRDRLVSTRLYGGGERREKVKFVLQRIEEAFGHKERIDTANLTIEHVMPQTLTPEWQTELGETWEDDEALLHTLGNLTLTGYNSELSNSPYNEKRKTYVESNFVLNRYFADISHWNANEIERRAESLAEVALSIWPHFNDASEVTLESEEIIDDDVTATLPRSVTFRGKKHDVRSWADVLLITFEQIISLGNEEFENVAAALSRWVGRDSSKFRRARRMKILSNGAFIETNLSALRIYRLCQQALGELGIAPEEWTVDRVSLRSSDRGSLEGEDAAPNETGELRLAFWQAMRSKLLATGKFPSIRAERAQNWFDLAMGRSGFWLSLTANMQAGTVAVKLMVKSEEEPDAIANLLQSRLEIEREIGHVLEWDLFPEKKHRSIRLVHAVNVSDRGNWHAATDWLCKTACSFRMAFVSRIELIP